MVTTALASVVLGLLRVTSEMSFPEPVHRPTTGAEEEALFSIWKVTQHQPVFVDPLQIPYSGVVFNWLFFFSYGAVASLFTNGLHFDSAWIPSIARFLTLLATFAGAVVFLWIAEEQQLWPQHWSRWEKVSIAAIVLCNPVAGFFIFSARPDMAALLFELVGLLLFLRFLRAHNWALLVYATIALFCAWSFKQTSAFVVLGICLWLGLSRKLRELMIVIVITASLYIAAVAIGGVNYTHAILESQHSCEFHFSFAVANLITACGRAPLLPLGLGVWIAALFSREPTWRNRTRSPLAVVFVVCFFCYLVIAAKEGAGSNYFITPSVLGALWLIGSWAEESNRKRSLILCRLVLLVLCLQLANAGGIIYARSRTDRAVAEHERHRDLARELTLLEAPILVGERFDNLPWIQRKPPHFVYAYMYAFDRRAGRPFAAGGLAGLIRDRYFRSIVLRNKPEASASYDGAKLDGYVRVKSTDSYDFYVLETGDLVR